MRKKLLITAALLFFSSFAVTGVAAQNVGEVTGMVQYSALDTYINNYPIRAYYADGRQMVCAEDLVDYGFNVVWDGDVRTLSIDPDYSVTELKGQGTVYRQYYMQRKKYKNIVYSDIRVFLAGNEIEGHSINGKIMIKIKDLEALGHVEYSAEQNYSKAWIDGLPQTEYAPLPIDYDTRMIIVLDPGHGKSSSLMSADEKVASGYYNRNGSWGEWRHWKSGTMGVECEGSDCNHNYTCWYPIGNGDRDKEPEINLRNALAAKNYLENTLGYKVRLTRETNNENPSFRNRVAFCFPNNDLNAEPDAAVYVCLHSNAGGGRGSAYIEATGGYDQMWVDRNFAYNSNQLGSYINKRIVSETSLNATGGGKIGGEGYLILFNKCPVPAGYMEIGFYDSSDLNILNSEYEYIGRAIAYGINDYMIN